MKNLKLQKENLISPYITVNDKHVHYKSDIPLEGDGIENRYGWVDLGLPSGKIYSNGDVLSLEDDAASVNMGGRWHMPTKSDIQELIDNTTSYLVNYYEEYGSKNFTMPGRLFVSLKDRSKKLFVGGLVQDSILIQDVIFGLLLVPVLLHIICGV